MFAIALEYLGEMPPLRGHANVVTVGSLSSWRLAVDLSEYSDEALTPLWVRRQCGEVLGESIAALAPLERLGSDVLTILLRGKEPTKERLAVSGRQLSKRGTQPEILIRTEMMRRRFESRGNSELLHDALNVGMDDLPGESELGCDRAAVHPLRQEVEHPTLVWSELRFPIPLVFGHQPLPQ
jgi:hypothetical protein